MSVPGLPSASPLAAPAAGQVVRRSMLATVEGLWHQALRRLPWLWPYGGLGVMLALVAWPTWLNAGLLAVGGDALVHQYPLQVLWRDAVAAGEWPFWNPYTMGGMPALADPHSAYFYPPHWLLLWAPPLLALNWSIGLHLVLAGLGAAWCAGRMGANREGQALAGATFALGSATTGRLWAGHLDFFEAVAWLPLATGLALGIRCRRTIASLALVVGLVMLTGRADVLLFACWWLPLWAALGARAEGRPPAGPMIRTAVALVLGLGLAAVQVLPTLALTSVSNRQDGVGWESAVIGSLPPWHLLGALAPDIFGGPDGGYWPGPGWEWHERLLFVGLVPLFAAAGVGGRWRWACWIAAGIAVALAFGRFAPWYWGVYALVPGYDSVRVPGRHLILAALALALAAGLGLERLHGRRVFAAAMAAAVLLGVAHLTLGHWIPFAAELLGEKPAVQRAAYEQAALPLLVAGVTLLVLALTALLPPSWAARAQLALAVVELLLVLGPYRFQLSDPRELLARRATLGDYERAVVIGDLSSGNLGPLVKTVQPGGYVPLFSVDYSVLITGAVQEGVGFSAPRASDPVLRLLGYQAIVEPSSSRVTAIEPPRPRVWVARCSWPGDALTVRARDFPRGRCVTRAEAIELEEPVPAGPASIEREGLDSLEVRARGPGYLFTPIPWYPGWSASVDDVPAEVERLDGALVGVPLPAGEHRVSLRYRPAGLEVGAAMSLAAGLMLLVLGWRDRSSRFRRDGPSRSPRGGLTARFGEGLGHSALGQVAEFPKRMQARRAVRLLAGLPGGARVLGLLTFHELRPPCGERTDVPASLLERWRRVEGPPVFSET